MDTVVEPYGGVYSEVKSGKLYLIRYGEDLWKSLDAERQQHCKDTWLRHAKDTDAARIALQLIPDELFPMHGNEKPYIEWQEVIDRPPDCGFTSEVVATFTLTSGCVKYIDPCARAAMTRRAGELQLPPGTHYRIVDGNGNLIEHGKL